MVGIDKLMNYATASFFDDIRTENTNKTIHIGGYTNSITVNALPWELPSLWVSIQFGTPIDKIDIPVRVVVRFPGVSEPHVTQLDLSPKVLPAKPDEAKHFIARINVPFGNVTLIEEGRIDVVVETESGDRVQAGRISVIDLSKNDGDNFVVAINSIPPFLAKYRELKESSSDADVGEFAASILENLSQFMSEESVHKILSGFNGKIIYGDMQVGVLFPRPLKETPNSIVITSPVPEHEYQLKHVSRFGFELHYLTPQVKPGEFEYEIHPR